MNHLKKILFVLAVAVGLVLVGTSTASAQTCSAVAGGNSSGLAIAGIPTTGAVTIRAEGRTELVAAVSITCIPIVAATTATVTVTLNGANFALGQGTATSASTTATTCVSGTAPDDVSKFPCPVLNLVVGGALSAAIPTAVASVAGNTATFIFTPPVGAQTLVIYGLRADAGGAGLSNGSLLTAVVNMNGSYSIVNAGPIQLATVNNGISTKSSAPSGFNGGGNVADAVALALPVFGIAACSPLVITPSGTPSTIKTGVDPSTAGVNSLQAVFQEGFANAWRASAANGGTEDMGATAAGILAPTLALNFVPYVGAVGARNGTRFIIVLTGVPSGISVYAPRTVPPKADTRSGFLTGLGLNAAKGVTGMVVTRVIGNDVDGSGGAPGAVNQDQFDFVPASSTGTVTLAYEVTTEDLTAAHTLGLTIELTGLSPIGIGTISGAIGFAPAGTPSINPSRPQFIGAGKASGVVVVNACASFLLFPWVAETNDGNYSTGMAIANTSSDPPGGPPSGIGTASQTGDVTLFFFPSDGSASFNQKIGTGVKGGQTVTFVTLSLKKVFTGYVIAVCGFSYGHGFAFIDNPIGGQNGFAQGYLALSVSSPRNLTAGNLAIPNGGGTAVEITGQ